MTDPIARCRYLLGNGERCSGEVVAEDVEILLCTTHLARAMELLRRVGALPE